MKSTHLNNTLPFRYYTHVMPHQQFEKEVAKVFLYCGLQIPTKHPRQLPSMSSDGHQ